MNLVYGEIAEIISGQDRRRAKLRAGGASKLISLHLLTDPAPGDKVLVCEGVAIGKVEDSAL